MARKMNHFGISRLDEDGVAINEGGLEGTAEGKAEFGVGGNNPLL